MFRLCCPPCQLLAVAMHSKSCDVPALTAACRAPLGRGGCQLDPRLPCRMGGLAFASSLFLAQLRYLLCLASGRGMLGEKGMQLPFLWEWFHFLVSSGGLISFLDM